MNRSLAALCLLFLTVCAFSQTQESKSSPVPDDLASIHQLLASPKHITWLFTGDSITQGAKWTVGARPFSEIFSERIRWELSRPHDLVINSGVSGNRTPDLLNDFDWRVAHLHPDVVFVMFGMNDCTAATAGEAAFRDHIQEIVTRIRQLGAIPILETTNPILGDPHRDTLATYNEITRQVAAKDHTILVDNWSYWQQHRTAEDLHEWMANAVHPNAQGHAQIAGEIFRVLGISDPASPMVQLAVP